MKCYDIAILGATMFAAGIIQSLSEEKKKDCIVIESSFGYASDFVPAMKATPLCKPVSELSFSTRTTELLGSLVEKGMISSDGRIHVIPFSFVCSTLLSGCGKVLLGTSVTSVEKSRDDKDLCVIKYVNSAGLDSVCASKIIDTTNLGFMRSYEGLRLTENSDAKKYFCASLVKHSDNAKDISSYFDSEGEVFAVKGALEDEYILKLSVPENADFAKARELIAAKWAYLSENEFDGWRIGAVASSFEYDYPSAKRIEKNLYDFIPSTSYGDPVSAFEGGYRCF